MFPTFFSDTLIPATHRGVRHARGLPVAWLEPGLVRTWFPGPGREIELISVDGGWSVRTPELVAVAPSDTWEALDVADDELAVVSVHGRPTVALSAGRYVLWKVRSAVTAEVWSTAPVFSEVPSRLWRLLPSHLVETFVVAPHERFVLVVDGEVHTVCEPGAYAVNVVGRQVVRHPVDLRDRSITVGGQDVLTADQATLRLSLLLRWRVVDPVRFVTASGAPGEALYGEAQIAARRAIGALKLDALLAQRGALGERLADDVRSSAEALGIELIGLDVKDLVLPGEVKDILHRVLTAEREAAANVIRRREEIAATRSLQATAKLLDENPTLLRLKELETVEAVASKVAGLTIVTGPEGLRLLR